VLGFAATWYGFVPTATFVTNGSAWATLREDMENKVNVIKNPRTIIAKRPILWSRIFLP
jgi:hypothetical protein